MNFSRTDYKHFLHVSPGHEFFLELQEVDTIRAQTPIIILTITVVP